MATAHMVPIPDAEAVAADHPPHRHVRHLYRLHFCDQRRERMFLASASFALTFLAVRAMTSSIRAGVGPLHNVAAGGTHLHHLVWGILLLLGVGYAWLAQVGTGLDGSRRWMRATAVLYGLAAALTLDEFALWLTLTDVYWSAQGRASVDAVLAFGAVLSVGVWGGPFLHALARFLVQLAHARLRLAHAHLRRASA